jgi:hypothetical protein
MGSRLALASPGQLSQHMFRKNVFAKELRSLSHQPEQRVLSIRTDKRDIRQINHQLSPVKMFSGPLPGTLHLRCPGANQFAFQYQAPLAVRFNDGDLEHCEIVSHWMKATELPTPQVSAVLVNC